MSGRDGKVSARPATPDRETAATGEKSVKPTKKETRANDIEGRHFTAAVDGLNLIHRSRESDEDR